MYEGGDQPQIVGAGIYFDETSFTVPQIQGQGVWVRYIKEATPPSGGRTGTISGSPSGEGSGFQFVREQQGTLAPGDEFTIVRVYGDVGETKTTACLTPGAGTPSNLKGAIGDPPCESVFHSRESSTFYEGFEKDVKGVEDVLHGPLAPELKFATTGAGEIQVVDQTAHGGSQSLIVKAIGLRIWARAAATSRFDWPKRQGPMGRSTPSTWIRR